MSLLLPEPLTDIDRSEALRYLGCPPELADAGTLALLDGCCEMLLDIVEPRWVWRVGSVSKTADGLLLDERLLLPGCDLRRQLHGCGQAVVFGVTLGAGVDKAIRRAQSRDLALGLGLDAAASAAVEQLCDQLETRLRPLFPGLYLTRRFSPGYGDLPLDVQRPLLDWLEADRRIGLFATESNILTPRKSVTAIIGLTPAPPVQTPTKCADCPRHDGCRYRQAGGHCGLF